MSLSFSRWPTFEDRLRWSDELFRSFMPFVEGALQARRSAGVFPPVNIYDDGEAFMVRAEIPGVDKGSLDISVKGKELTLRGERKIEPTRPEADFHRRECKGGQFRRVVTLPDAVEADKISASYKDGVLEVVLPRVPEVQPRKITIQ